MLWLIIILLVVVIYQLAKLKQAVGYLQQDHMDMSEKLFPEDSQPIDDDV